MRPWSEIERIRLRIKGGNRPNIQAFLSRHYRMKPLGKNAGDCEPARRGTSSNPPSGMPRNALILRAIARMPPFAMPADAGLVAGRNSDTSDPWPPI